MSAKKCWQSITGTHLAGFPWLVTLNWDDEASMASYGEAPLPLVVSPPRQTIVGHVVLENLDNDYLDELL
jgi:hypothetical protein